MPKSATSIKTQESDRTEEEAPDPLSRQSEVGDLDEEPPGTALAVNKNRFLSHVPQEQWDDWKWHFRNRITTIEQLVHYIPLSAKEQRRLKLVINKYPLSVTPFYLSLIDPADPDDPLRKQAVPCFEEVALAGIGVEDPLGEGHDSVVPGLVHRYPNRVLMVLTDLCSMLCRHCTRKREWRHGGWVRPPAQIDAMLDYIRSHKEVRDVVLSGGDPLTLSTARLESVISRLRQIEHVEIIRIGTRFPVVLPQRIDDELCAMLSRYGPIWLNTQFNHHREITPEAARACDKLLRAGVPVSNQTVLLRGINDTVEAQTKLCHGLLKIKVRPYYLFQCDEVQGTEHFRTPVETGLRIIQGMRGYTSGLAVPTFVVDLPQGGGKVPLQPNYVISHTDEELILRNYEGPLFQYRNPRDPKLGTARPARSSGNGGNGRNGSNGGNGIKTQLAFPDLISLS
ncbi:MAG: KamA family radical SAM protein [Dehalococcoidia bacterium]|nr:KamA family radical SAM protein [Dehalococcoidia bacterium]